MAVTKPGTKIVTKIIFPVSEIDEAGYGWVAHRRDEILHLALVDSLDRGANRAAGHFHVQDVGQNL